MTVDPLLHARSKRLRGHIRFQKDVDQEHRRMQLARERLERAIEEVLAVRFDRQARITDDVTYTAMVTFPGKTMIAGGKHAHYEIMAAAAKELSIQFASLIGDGMREGSFQKPHGVQFVLPR